MRHLELLIDRSRELSQNTRYSADSGISQRTFTQFFQNAQDFIVREIINAKTKYFIKTGSPRVAVSGQEQYTYPSDIFLQGIDTIEWSSNQQSWNFLDKGSPKDRNSSQNGFAFGYSLERAGYIVSPPLNGGYLRETYNQRPKRLEKRSGKVTAVTGTPITSITIDTSFAGHDPTYLDQFASLTIVGRDGVPKVASLPISDVTAGTITVETYTLGSGEAIAAGDFVLAEGNTTNLPDYDDTIESFLILHATYQAKYGDSSQWTAETWNDVQRHASQIVTSFSVLAEDITQVPITNIDFLMF